MRSTFQNRAGDTFGTSRRERYGDVYKTNILGAPTVMVYGEVGSDVGSTPSQSTAGQKLIRRYMLRCSTSKHAEFIRVG